MQERTTWPGACRRPARAPQPSVVSTRVGRIERGPVALTAVVLASMALLVVAVAENAHPVSLSLVAFALLAAALSSAALTKWSTLLVGLVLVILFIPIRRYTLPGSLPFDLEPYRVLVAVVCLLWLAAILVDSRVRPRRSGLEGPLALIAVGAIASVLANIPRIEELDVSSDVAKKLNFFARLVENSLIFRSKKSNRFFAAKPTTAAGTLKSVFVPSARMRRT